MTATSACTSATLSATRGPWRSAGAEAASTEGAEWYGCAKMAPVSYDELLTEVLALLGLDPDVTTQRALTYLKEGDYRTAHNLLVDVCNTFRMEGAVYEPRGAAVLPANHKRALALVSFYRLDTDGSIGRPVDESPPKINQRNHLDYPEGSP